MTNKKIGLAAGIIALLLVVAALIAFNTTATPVLVTNYDQCVAAGYPILESYPEQCKTPDGRTFVNDTTVIHNPLPDLITVTAPQAGAVVTSPLVVTGQARGSWYFEASFPVTLLDANGTILTQVPAQAQSDWMTTEFVPFKATITFKAPATGTGVLVLKNDNPSGEPANDKEIRIPVRFTALPLLQAVRFDTAATLDAQHSFQFPDGLQISLNRINDSRCKPDVQCIWAGELQAMLTLVKGSTSQGISIGTVNAKTVTALGYTVTLQAATETTATIIVRSAVASGGASGISGYVSVGPICPVDRVPPSPTCYNQPLTNAKVEIRTTAGGALVKQVTTDSQGKFAVSVDARSYVISVVPASGAAPPRCTDTATVVKEGLVASVEIICDSGIR